MKVSTTVSIKVAQLVAAALLTAIVIGLFYATDLLPCLRTMPERPALRRQ